jgi:hypothetical protein
MIKFRLKEDWYVYDFFDKVKIYDAGHVFCPSEDGRYIMKGLNNTEMYLRFDDMLKVKGIGNDGKPGDPIFEVINDQEIELIVEEVPEDKDNEIKNWRIQLDVKTSLKNLKKIEVFIKENIQEML